jgi:hypothetical protein
MSVARKAPTDLPAKLPVMAAGSALLYSSRLASLVNTRLADGFKKPIANPMRVTIQETFVARHGKIRR